MPKVRFSPALFLVLETLILFPSLCLILGIVVWNIAKIPYLYSLVMGGGFLQNIGVLLLSPLSSGILAYGYLERYKAKGWSAIVSKIILAYSIIFLGLLFVYVISTLFS